MKVEKERLSLFSALFGELGEGRGEEWGKRCPVLIYAEPWAPVSQQQQNHILPSTPIACPSLLQGPAQNKVKAVRGEQQQARILNGK